MAVTARTIRSSGSGFDQGIQAAFADALPALPGSGWMQQLRADALARFVPAGLPHRRVEWWKYTDLAASVQASLMPTKPSPGTARERNLFARRNFNEVEIVEGQVTAYPHSGLEDGVEIMPLREALAVPSLWLRPWFQPGDDAIGNLNLAFVSDGALIRVGRGIKVTQPVCIRSHFSTSGTMAHTRSVVAVEDGAELTLIEVDHITPERQAFTTSQTSYVLGVGARLNHVRVMTGSLAGLAIRSDTVEIAQDAEYRGLMLTAGPSLARQDVRVRLSGAGARYDIACAYAAASGQLADFSLELTHVAPQTTSRILAKGIASGSGHGVVQGRVRVEREAQQSDSHQLARGLMLTPGAEIDHRPELEIYADDVKCGHGATIGALDQNQLFYLQSRGIPEAEARQMLVAAYFGEISLRAPDALRDELESWIAENMTSMGGAA